MVGAFERPALPSSSLSYSAFPEYDFPWAGFLVHFLTRHWVRRRFCCPTRADLADRSPSVATDTGFGGGESRSGPWIDWLLPREHTNSFI